MCVFSPLTAWAKQKWWLILDMQEFYVSIIACHLLTPGGWENYYYKWFYVSEYSYINSILYVPKGTLSPMCISFSMKIITVEMK